ncbi:peptidylprolyl isomerase [bacterium]|nr:peptidylprolyl isomerase [bacterium]
MTRLGLSLFAGVMMLALASGCPKDSGGQADTSAEGAPTTSAPPPETSAPPPATDEAPSDAPDNPCDENPCSPSADAGEAPVEDPVNPCGDTEEEAEMPADDVTQVVLETTKGAIVLAVHADWAPIGAAHFLELVEAGFYDGAPWFRVIDGFMAQCGVSADVAMNVEWGEKTIMDEPVVMGNKRGYISFGKTGAPNSRSTHIFINFGDNTGNLDPQGFSAFAEVVEGMEAADSLTRCEYRDQGGLAAKGGLERFKSQFPEADFITRAYIKE